VGAEAVKDELCLANVTFRGATRKDDMHIFASLLLENRGLSGVERDLKCRLITHLAMWDDEAARDLAKCDLGRLLEPNLILKELADRRGWSDLSLSDLDEDRLWELGATEHFDGEMRRHSALYAIQAHDRKLERRIWTAEVEVLLPWIEIQRRKLLERFGSLVQRPFFRDQRRRIQRSSRS